MSLLAWFAITVLAGCILAGILSAWIADDDPAAHAERDAHDEPGLRARVPEHLRAEALERAERVMGGTKP